MYTRLCPQESSFKSRGLFETKTGQQTDLKNLHASSTQVQQKYFAKLVGCYLKKNSINKCLSSKDERK